MHHSACITSVRCSDKLGFYRSHSKVLEAIEEKKTVYQAPD